MTDWRGELHRAMADLEQCRADRDTWEQLADERGVALDRAVAREAALEVRVSDAESAAESGRAAVVALDSAVGRAAALEADVAELRRTVDGLRGEAVAAIGLASAVIRARDLLEGARLPAAVRAREVLANALAGVW